MSEATVHGAAHAGKEVGMEALDVVIDYIVPIGTAVAGWVAGPGIFGGSSLITMLQTGQLSSTISTAGANRLAGAVLGGVTGLIGYAFWRLGKRDGWAMRILGKSIGGFFLGTAAAYLVTATLLGSTATIGSGIIEKFSTGAQQIAQGG